MKLARVAVLGIAVGAGLVAAIIAMRLSAPAPAPEVAATDNQTPAPTVQVLVATKDVPIGGKLQAESMQWQDWPRSGVNPHFIERAGAGDTQIQPLVGAIARASIYQGEPISESKIIHSDHGFMSAILPEGKRAVATRIAADTSAGGFILPNDRVDVIMTRAAPSIAAGGGNAFLTETILNNVRVLAIDQTIENTDSGSSTGNTSTTGQTVIGQTATLELTPQQVQILSVAQQMSDHLTLALRSVADSKTGPADSAGDALHLIGGTKRNGAVTVVRNGVASDVSGIR